MAKLKLTQQNFPDVEIEIVEGKIKDSYAVKLTQTVGEVIMIEKYALTRLALLMYEAENQMLSSELDKLRKRNT